MTENFSTIQYLLEVYFHQDWTDNHASAEEVIHGFLVDESRSTISDLRNELEVFQNMDGTVPQDLISQLGGQYLPDSDDLPAEVWIANIADMIDRF